MSKKVENLFTKIVKDMELDECDIPKCKDCKYFERIKESDLNHIYQRSCSQRTQLSKYGECHNSLIFKEGKVGLFVFYESFDSYVGTILVVHPNFCCTLFRGFGGGKE